LKDISTLISDFHIDGIMVATEEAVPERYLDLQEICLDHGVFLRLIAPRIDHILEHVHVHDLTGIPLATRKSFYRRNVFPIIKRGIDLLLASIALLILAPLFFVIAIGIKLSSKGPILFIQPRKLAPYGEEIPFIKFRTMSTDADSLKYDDLAQKNEADGALFKIRDDPRVFPLGVFLRRHSLDELPQFINVLLGQMSLVGPRPLPSKDFERLLNSGLVVSSFYQGRAGVMPGITGLWQISGRSDLSFTDMVLMDLYYIEAASIMLDLEILMETVPVVLFRRGAF